MPSGHWSRTGDEIYQSEIVLWVLNLRGFPSDLMKVVGTWDPSGPWHLESSASLGPRAFSCAALCLDDFLRFAAVLSWSIWTSLDGPLEWGRQTFSGASLALNLRPTSIRIGWDWTHPFAAIETRPWETRPIKLDNLFVSNGNIKVCTLSSLAWKGAFEFDATCWAFGQARVELQRGSRKHRRIEGLGAKQCTVLVASICAVLSTSLSLRACPSRYGDFVYCDCEVRKVTCLGSSFDAALIFDPEESGGVGGTESKSPSKRCFVCFVLSDIYSGRSCLSELQEMMPETLWAAAETVPAPQLKFTDGVSYEMLWVYAKNGLHARRMCTQARWRHCLHCTTLRAWQIAHGLAIYF